MDIKKVQYFIFFPDRFEVSDIGDDIDCESAESWDTALADIDNCGLTWIVSNTENWQVLKIGHNPYNLKFLAPGSYQYTGEFEKFKHLAK